MRTATAGAGGASPLRGAVVQGEAAVVPAAVGGGADVGAVGLHPGGGGRGGALGGEQRITQLVGGDEAAELLSGREGGAAGEAAHDEHGFGLGPQQRLGGGGGLGGNEVLLAVAVRGEVVEQGGVAGAGPVEPSPARSVTGMLVVRLADRTGHRRGGGARVERVEAGDGPAGRYDQDGRDPGGESG